MSTKLVYTIFTIGVCRHLLAIRTVGYQIYVGMTKIFTSANTSNLMPDQSYD
ncbi:hypothetical protein OMCYN_01849 [cyanobiont of Ornithocercus magnificus]|nr:hypothetical protein OMCYN_01849 [cyanobiont of Ornithocercus magnificus]